MREAVRDLALHALRSRLLTAEHIASVVRAVGEGIESSPLAQAVSVRESRRGAWAGLEDAVVEALHAIELAAREFADGRARLMPGEREQVLSQIARMERSLGEGWQSGHCIPSALKARIGSVTDLLRRAVSREATETASDEEAFEAGRVLSLVASGVLLGLSEALRESRRTGATR